ncbi:hypothetical protein BGZ99_003976, partial [Dissophora globulifera]
MDENTILSLCFPSAQVGGPVDEVTTRIFQQLCDEQSLLHHCQATLQVSVNSNSGGASNTSNTSSVGPVGSNNNSAVSSANSSTSTLAAPPKITPSLDTRHPSIVYNVALSGSYQGVMLARGTLLRNSPLKPRLSIPVSRSLLASSAPQEAISPDSTSKQDTITSTRDQSAAHPAQGGALALLSSSSPSQSLSSSSPSPASIPTVSAAIATAPPTPSSGSQSGRRTDVDTQEKPLPSLPSSVDRVSSSGGDSQVGSLKLLAASSSSSSLLELSPLTANSSPTLTVQPKFMSAVSEISAATRTTIALMSSASQAAHEGRPVVAGFARQDMVELQVTGTWENAEAARMLLLVAIDTLKPGVVSDKLTVELKFQNMIGGKKRQDLQELMARTRTNIYLTSPLVQTANKSGIPVDSRYNDIYITGPAKQVAIAKEALSRAHSRAQSESPSCTRQVNIATRKLDWMLLNHREKLRSIMMDNATFIAFPPLGGTHPTISVYGESGVNVERTIRMVMQLSCHFHSGSIVMRDIALPIHTPHTASSLVNICKLVSQASGAEVEYRSNGFLVFGSEIQTRLAMQFLTDVDIVKALPSEFKFSVELANEHRDFISGKKNGKINRIMKTTGAKIKFDQCNEYNFYVDLSSTISLKAIEALALLQEELPAEISFFVPETYHKRIIGVGGKNIQRIMKKYGVYVKFSNADEFATLGGYFDNLDNVVARTPSKNAFNLENLKHSVMEHVQAKDKDFVSHRLMIPKHYHLALLSDHAMALSEIHEATNSTVLFPAREIGSDIVTVSGPESLIQQAITMLLSMVEEQYILPVKSSEALTSVLDLSEFKVEVVDAVKRVWNMTLIVPEIKQAKESGPPQTLSRARAKTTDSVGGDECPEISHKDQQPSTASSTSTPNDEVKSGDKVQTDVIFVFEYTRNNEDYLQSAKDLLVDFLVNHQVDVYEDELQVARPRSSSFGESFVHFHSRVASSTAVDLTSVQGSPDYALFDNPSTSFDSIAGNTSAIGVGSALANSDIRSLFTASTSSALPSLDTSPSRWSDHARHLGAFPSSPSAANTGSSTPGSAYGLGPVSGIGQNSSGSTTYPRVSTSTLPSDPWAPAKHQQRQSQSPASFLGSIGDLRSTPTGLSHGVASIGSGYYTSGGYSQNQHSSLHGPEAAFNKAPGFQSSGSTASSHRYSGGNSPVQGPTTSIGNFGNIMGHQNSPQHGASNQRPSSGSSGRGSMQFLEEKMLSGSTFGPGYGPTLN